MTLLALGTSSASLRSTGKPASNGAEDVALGLVKQMLARRVFVENTQISLRATDIAMIQDSGLLVVNTRIRGSGGSRLFLSTFKK